MTAIQQILPHAAALDSKQIAANVRLQALGAATADNETEAYCAALSRALLHDSEARRYPALQALGYWLRPAAIDSMRRRFLAAPEGTRRLPAGTVFQLPPGNVATLFAYVSAIGLLCGNRVIVRLPQAANDERDILLRLISASLASTPDVARRLWIVGYGHDDAATADLSAVADVRMVWGSDETVDHLRRAPLPPLARHISFGDRFSTAAIDAKAYAALDDAGRDNLTRRMANDVYLFDQMACSSPRLLAWSGDAATVDAVAKDFYERLARSAAERGYRPGSGESVAKLSAAYLALHDLPVVSYTTYSPALSVLTLAGWEHFAAFKSVNYGFGLILAARIESLAALAGLSERRDQTLAHFGFTDAALQDFVTACAGRGFDRLVPVGEALAFDPVWDGINLFETMTRLVEVRS